MNRIDEIVDEISVCEHCMIQHANGEISPDRPADLPEPWSLLRFGYTVTMGGEHNDSCTDADREAGCDCDDLGFTQRSCEGCGDHHHGDRFRFTLWRYTTEYAHATAREHIGHARREASIKRPHSTRGAHLMWTAQWRGYLAERDREAREHAAWMARYAAPIAV